MRYLLLLAIVLVELGSRHYTRGSSLDRDGQQAVSCPNECSGQGACLNKAHAGYIGVCSCFPGFGGPDCSLRMCPGGKAWVDYPVSNDRAHNNFTECSNMGTCDRSTGNCACRFGFGGPACDTLLCPLGPSHSYDSKPIGGSPCGGNGRCISLRQAAATQDYVNFFNYTVYTDWDADMIYGCACNKGFEGNACQKRSCPKGIDPKVPAVNEVQLLDCQCSSSYCSGGLYLSFRNQQTAFIPYDASRQLVRFRLQQLSTLEQVSVKFTLQTKLCTTAGSSLRIEFKQPKGNVEAIQVRTQGGLSNANNVVKIVTSGAYSSIDVNSASNDGTYSYAPCSNRGECDYSRGVCVCYPGFRSSNGAGLSGSRGDCGFQQLSNLNISFGLRPYSYNETFPDAWRSQSSVTKLAYSNGCPFTNFGGVCNGQGICASATLTCMCNIGWEGPRCDRKSCGKAKTWFGDVGLLHSHWSVCGGVGECDYNTGNCVNCGGNFGVFAGTRCQFLTCPVNSSGVVCSGHGQCLSMKNLAATAYTDSKVLAGYTYNNAWDSDSIYGCSCYRSPTVDNVFTEKFDYFTPMMGNVAETGADVTSMFYRGPWANAATDFAGYLCANARCPRGDNPETRNDWNEVQSLVCQANMGSFTLTFRENTTEPIHYNSTASDLETSLQALPTIRRVNITVLSSGWSGKSPQRVCSASGNTTLYVEFQTEFGDLPLLRIANNKLGLRNSTATIPGTVSISEYQKGTKEDVECSRQGVCDETIGVCSCFGGYTSSNGSTNTPGGRGDCSFKLVY